jgi:DNA adenine methylase
LRTSTNGWPVVIENLDWLDFIDRYDRPGTLSILTHPTSAARGLREGSVLPRAFTKIANRLAQLKSRFVLSIREIFRGFAFEGVDLNYTIGAIAMGRPLES